MKNIRYLLALIICFSFFPPNPAFAAKSNGQNNNNNGYASISGYVTDVITGLAIADARVIVVCGSNRLKTNTNSLGYYEFDNIPISSKKNKLINSAQIIISAKNYISAEATQDILPEQVYVIDFKLDPKFSYPVIKGKIFDSSSLQGISAATVSARNNNKIFTAVTDDAGNYILTVELKNSSEISIVAEAAQFSSSIPIMIQALPSEIYDIDIPMDIIALGVSVSPDNWQIGNLNPNSVATMRSGQQITVTNTGNQNQTYSLMVISPEPWKASELTVDTEKYILNACFSSDVNNISWNEQNHALLDTLQRCTNTKFAAEQTGVNIMPGHQRTLWLQFKAPASTSVKNEQLIEVIINAEMP